MTRLTDGMERLAHFVTRGAFYHIVVGNDSHPALTALARAVIGGMIVGTLGFLTIWQETDDVKVLVSAGLTPFLTYVGMRFGVEGLVDVAKYNGGPPKPEIVIDPPEIPPTPAPVEVPDA